MFAPAAANSGAADASNGGATDPPLAAPHSRTGPLRSVPFKRTGRSSIESLPPLPAGGRRSGEEGGADDGLGGGRRASDEEPAGGWAHRQAAAAAGGPRASATEGFPSDAAGDAAGESPLNGANGNSEDEECEPGAALPRAADAGPATKPVLVLCRLCERQVAKADLAAHSRRCAARLSEREQVCNGYVTAM